MELYTIPRILIVSNTDGSIRALRDVVAWEQKGAKVKYHKLGNPEVLTIDKVSGVSARITPTRNVLVAAHPKVGCKLFGSPKRFKDACKLNGWPDAPCDTHIRLAAKHGIKVNTEWSFNYVKIKDYDTKRADTSNPHQRLRKV